LPQPRTYGRAGLWSDGTQGTSIEEWRRFLLGHSTAVSLLDRPERLLRRTTSSPPTARVDRQVLTDLLPQRPHIDVVPLVIRARRHPHRRPSTTPLDYRPTMTEPADHTTPSALQRLADLTASAGGALVGYTVGGPEGAVIGNTTAPALTLAWHLGNQALAAQLARGSRALDVAAQTLDTDLEDLAARATADDGRLELLARVLEAAGRTPLPEKIPALGRVLALGLDTTTGDSVDLVFAYAAALDELEAPHLTVLTLLDSEAIGPSFATRPEPLPGWLPSEVIDRLPGHRYAMPSILRTLERHALLEDPIPGSWPTRDGEHPITTSDLGQQCLELLRGQD
jgi:hypothetical protein